MNVATITMDPVIARKKLQAYRADLHKDTEQVYRETATAYEKLAKGLPLIRLSRAIQQGGFYHDMRPKLAIARADRKEVRFQWNSGVMARFDSGFDTKGRQPVRTSLDVNMGREHGRTATNTWNGKPHTYSITVQGFALVPMVPADVRPKHGQLIDMHILWEVDHWADRSQTARAPVDPMLLQHVGGDLYAVLATWDLTPVEQAILEGALRS